MVRRPAALLSRGEDAAALGLAAAALVAGEAYLLAAPALPELHPVDLSLIVARLVGVAAILAGVAVAAAVIGITPRRAWRLAVPALVAMAIMNVADVGAGASVVEAVAYGAVGAGLALGMLEPALVLGVPVLVGLIDLVSVLVAGPAKTLAHGHTKPGDPLSLEVADWGNGLPAGRLGFSDVVIAGALVAWARHYGLRTAATVVALWAAIMIAGVIAIEADRAIPVMPFMALGFFAVNADRIAPLWRAAVSR